MKQLRYFVWELSVSHWRFQLQDGRREMPIPTVSSAEVSAAPALDQSSPTRLGRVRSGANVSKKHRRGAVARYQVMAEEERIFVANSFFDIRGLVLAGLWG